MTVMKNLLWIPALAVCAALGSCDAPDSAASVTEAAAPSAELESVFVSRITDEPSPIHLARTTAQPGDFIVLEGTVMGAVEPFVEGRAVFILGDRAKLTPCNENADDGCPTPWDACCDTKADRRDGTAMIQVVGEDERPLKEGIAGVSGLEKLTRLHVKGRVAESSGQGNLVVNATEIQVLD